jgi:alpha-L-rhamnosidase
MTQKTTHHLLAVLTFFIAGLSGSVYPAVPIVVDLKCENLVNPNAIDNTTPHLSWKTLYDGRTMEQRFYEIQVASDILRLSAGDADLWDTGEFASASSVMIPYNGAPLSSRSLCYWRVRIRNNNDEVSAWSDIARFGVGILHKSEWAGTYIGLSTAAGNAKAPLLRKKFMVDDITTAFLHVNSLGYHEVYLNGVKVDDAVLSPAVSQLNKRSLTVTRDVTSYLQKGENELVLWLGTGWYKNTAYDIAPIAPTPDGAKALAQLDLRKNATWETILFTDASWYGRTTGYEDTGSWNAARFGGEKVDAGKNPDDLSPETLEALDWLPVVEMAIPDIELSPQMTEHDKIQEVLTPLSMKKIGSNSWLIDMGKSVTGWFEMKMPRLSAGQTVVFEYSDFLDAQGAIEQQGQKDQYIASGKGDEIFCNKFNYHAFRYVKVTMKSTPAMEDIRAYLIHTDYKQASSFECSDADLNAIHNMIQYTMRCLTHAGYMVDCPHLERAGYGGDGNSSTMTLQTMYDVSPLFANWLTAWGDAMREGGSLPYVAPNPGGGGGGPYWCGFIIMAPWRTYVNYGDDRLIRKHYPAMKQWLEYVDRCTVDGLFKSEKWPNADYRIWCLGDWLAPSGNSSTDELVHNCFISLCFDTMSKIAGVLGKTDDALQFKQRRETLNELIHRTYYRAENENYGTISQLDFSFPMLVGATPAHLYETVKNKLIEETTKRKNGHIGVGLVGVPILTEWAIANKAVDYIYTMLKKRNYPGYLYMIDNGATTTWEYWSGERSRIHNCYNGIGIWFYQAVGGIRPDDSRPGYRHVYLEPQIPSGVTWAKTTKETPYGPIAFDWQLTPNEKLELSISLPTGVTATVILPEETRTCTMNGENVSPTADRTLEIGNGVYNVTVFFNHPSTVSDTETQSVGVYPNPFSDHIVLDAAISSRCTIYDLSGRTVWEQKAMAGQNSINTSLFPKGVYILKHEDKAVKIIK